MLEVKLAASRQSYDMCLGPFSLHVLILLMSSVRNFQLQIPSSQYFDVEEKLSLHSLGDLMFPSAGTCL